ncbi:SubName: Full=Related to tetracycline resistance protein (Probable transport protein) {ECO:0000313/EMBL:CCA69908.1} [Serendipita indica DSM 11827]|uniref:Related to tetracycline resistance protein (Probable transport protein) n=1 Tax=Serendipita indica (strain DSM 11827) TaxID=1109443 RepID=G4TF15_SERID|nr:SubName: Full=Related to tetracycline resistance protein (Probable transport protein) {ECO:0000313/EMBL:CCA69908.1} [Serendipita indica DSM 11827]CCA69908.1 related to tetracycline resistance protein (probable transport protein) [Serendipita indica DSM 11827]
MTIHVRRQIWVLLAVQAVLPFSFEIIFPFVNQFLLEIGVVDNPADVGFYSGFVESAFAVTQLLTVFPATWAADHYGRKPVLVLSTLGVAVSMATFGLSTRYWMLIASRLIAGGLGGSGTALRVMVSEVSDKNTEVKHFTWVTMAYRTGQIIGQPIGGILSHPERQWPSIFGARFWYTYPYALPCFVAAGYALICAVLAQLVLKETMASSRGTVDTKHSPPGEHDPLLQENSSAAAKKTKSPSALSVLSLPLASLLFSNATMVLLTEIFFATYPLICATPIELGGLGLSEVQIGIHMSIRSLLHIFIMLPYRPLQSKLGTMAMYRLSLVAWLPTILIFPFLHILARQGLEDGVVWYATLLVLFTIWAATGWSWASIFVLSSAYSPNPESVATVQALLSASVIAPQTLAPALGTSTFAFAIQHKNLFNGNLFWVGTFLLASAAVLHCFTLHESKHDWRAQRGDSADNPTETA